MNQFEAGFRPRDPALETAIGRASRLGHDGRFDDAESDASAFDLRALLGLLRRQKWTIIATTVVGVALGALYVSQVPRQYTATTSLVVDARASDMLGDNNGLNDGLGLTNVVSTEVEIIRSSSVLGLAAQSLNLPSSPAFAGETRLERLLNIVGLGPSPDEIAARANPQDWADLTTAEQDRWTRRLAEHIEASQRGATNVITISATTSDPAISANWANAVANAYLDEQVLSKGQVQERAVSVLQDRVTNAAGDVENIETQIDNFIIQAIDQAGTPEARAQLADLRNQMGALDAQRTNLTTLQAALNANDNIRLSQLVAQENPQLADQRTAFAQQLAGETDAQRAAQIQAQLQDLDNQIRQAAQVEAQSLQTTVATQQETVGNLQSQLNQNAATQNLPNDVLTDLFELQQRAQSSRTLYSTTLAQLLQAQQQAGFALPDSRVIADAVTPGSPSYPSVRSTLLMALLLSAAAGFGLAFLRENLIGGVVSVDHLEQVAGIPVIAAVPKYRSRVKEEPDWAIVEEPLSAFSEAIRRARIGIESIVPDQQLKLLITSAAPGEGKTTVALSIARSFAKAGKSTILIDADLRHPSVHRHVNHTVEFGLIDYLLQGRAAETAHLFMMQEEATGLNLILGSEASSVATDSLILSKRFRSVIEYAVKEYDTVIIDLPPVGLVVDPQIIAREFANVGLFVVKAEATGQRGVKGALHDMVMHTDIPIVGLLNQVASKGRYYGKYAGYYK